MPAFLRKTIGITLLFVTMGLSTCQSFLEAGESPPAAAAAPDMNPEQLP